jgi:hypothetical protein
MDLNILKFKNRNTIRARPAVAKVVKERMKILADRIAKWTS